MNIISTLVMVVLNMTILTQSSYADAEIKVASKLFTENVILGDIAATIAKAKGFESKHIHDLGGSQILFKALRHGEINIYPEYTGTISVELLKGKSTDWRKSLEDMGILATEPLGFNNTYALAMKRDLASKLGIKKIFDLVNHPDLRYGLGNEFMSRNDGWPGVVETYSLKAKNVTGMQHDLAYRGLEGGSVQVMDAYSTDADIEYYDLVTLEDDKKYFPEYYGVFLFRKELVNSHPELVAALKSLSGTLSDEKMTSLNAKVKIEKMASVSVAEDFVQEALGQKVEKQEVSKFDSLLKNTSDHIFLSGMSLLAAILIAVPLGVLAAKVSSLGRVILGVVGMVQTIPSLALLVFFIPFFGIGAAPALVALFLYSLLPIVQNTYQGVSDISPDLKESAVVMGLPAGMQLRKIEIPLAMSSIIAGIKTAAVINIGTATLGAIIGAGGYGQPILTGIRLDDTALILSGAIPACILAILAQTVFGGLEYLMVPKGLRAKTS